MEQQLSVQDTEFVPPTGKQNGIKINIVLIPSRARKSLSKKANWTPKGLAWAIECPTYEVLNFA